MVFRGTCIIPRIRKGMEREFCEEGKVRSRDVVVVCVSKLSIWTPIRIPYPGIIERRTGIIKVVGMHKMQFYLEYHFGIREDIQFRKEWISMVIILRVCNDPDDSFLCLEYFW
jgi:hypothetical protein